MTEIRMSWKNTTGVSIYSDPLSEQLRIKDKLNTERLSGHLWKQKKKSNQINKVHSERDKSLLGALRF